MASVKHGPSRRHSQRGQAARLASTLANRIEYEKIPASVTECLN
jgi:hypothetical protein